jgi:predicted RNA-binding Zn ribbon-like protein
MTADTDTTPTARPVYRVNVTRERGVWLADIPDVPGAHTFARSLSALQRSVREVIVLMTDRADEAFDTFDLDVRYDIGDSAAAVAAARRARVEAEQAERASADAVRRAVARLPVSLSVRDVAELLGISHQRVAQVRAELAGTRRAVGGRRAYAGG